MCLNKPIIVADFSWLYETIAAKLKFTNCFQNTIKDAMLRDGENKLILYAKENRHDFQWVKMKIRNALIEKHAWLD
jgi:hypothetical protein